MPITSKKLSARLKNIYPKIIEMRRAAIELQKVGEQVRCKRKSEDEKSESNSFNKLK